ncbi:MAG: anhydro-N-acetylmuramic acid kinase [Thermoproteota archaeon]
MLVIGLMSGTSIDGVDAVLTEITESDGEINVKYKDAIFRPYSKQLKEKLSSLLPPNKGTVKDLAYLHYYLAEEYAAAALALLEKTKLTPSNVGLIGCHGQTICNLPRGTDEFSPRARLQIGDISVIAVRTGITTVGDFRPADVAAGGDGGPLTPYFDFYAFKSKKQNRLVVNIGGIANVTYIPANASLDKVRGFDTGPGNMLIDILMQRLTKGKVTYDKDGEFAAKGKVNQILLDELLAHPFVQKAPPKSAGREEFGGHFADELLRRMKSMKLSPADLIATVTSFTTEAILFNCQRYLGPVDEVIVGGGGAYNRTLLAFLKESFKSIGATIRTTEDYGVPVKAREGMAIALLAYQAFHRRPNNVPSVTGAQKSVVLGKIAWGWNKEQLECV